MLIKYVHKLPIHSKWRLALRTIPYVVIIVLIKFIAHYFNYEFLSLNSLFTAIISANIFLISFLISGTLVDYKESEKLPGDLSACLETLTDEGLIISKNTNSQDAKLYLSKLSRFNKSLIDWFYKKERTENIMKMLRSFNDDFLAFESLTQANFIVRLKQEQNLIRKILIRIHTIRETSFMGTGYAIAEIITFILVIGLILIKMDPFYESIFFVFFVSFILIYMIHFIKDIDNPFGYLEGQDLGDEVSLKPIFDTKKRLESIINDVH